MNKRCRFCGGVPRDTGTVSGGGEAMLACTNTSCAMFNHQMNAGRWNGELPFGFLKPPVEPAEMRQLLGPQNGDGRGNLIIDCKDWNVARRVVLWVINETRPPGPQRPAQRLEIRPPTSAA
jgi:hypothetical protein